MFNLRRSCLVRPIGVLTLWILTGTAFAVDGVYEINASCATVGCFSGDSPGYPVTISQPGSYRLTSNLQTTDPDVTLIFVSSHNVSIDLNGFALLGPAQCTGTPVTSCTNTGIGHGINANLRDGLVVRNGAIHGLGARGIIARYNALIESVVLTENGAAGVRVEEGGILRRVIARRNGGNGAEPPLALVYDSIFTSNGDRGIVGGYCSNIVSRDNQSGELCFGIAPNYCDTPANCD
ncbi:MAG: hypothetical protein Kow0020_06590 [Wenzhouxiangellaceae bacterium]